jgi:hypothetical protein
LTVLFHPQSIPGKIKHIVRLIIFLVELSFCRLYIEKKEWKKFWPLNNSLGAAHDSKRGRHVFRAKFSTQNPSPPVLWRHKKIVFGVFSFSEDIWSSGLTAKNPPHPIGEDMSSSFWIVDGSLKIFDFMWKNMLARIWWWEKKRTADLNWLRFWSWPMATRQLARRKSLSLRRRAYCFAQNSILHFNWMSTLMKGINTFNYCFVEAIMYLFVGFLGCSLLHCFLLNLVQKNKIFICTSIEKIKILLPAFVQSWSFDENRNFLVNLALSHDELIVGYELVDRTF